MRIINVVKIKDGVVDDITSFGVFEEQLSDDVVKVAEADFVAKAKELGCEDDEETLEYLLDDGYYQIGNASVCISWSDIDE